MKKYPEILLSSLKASVWCSEEEGGAETEKCQVDYFDFYLCHAMNRERMDWLEKYEVNACTLPPYRKREGKIRHLGFSFHDTPDVRGAVKPLSVGFLCGSG